MGLQMHFSSLFFVVGCTMRDEMDQCCQVDPIVPLKDADECDSTAETSHPREKMMCAIECKLQSLGVLSGNEIVQSKLLEYANRLDGGWKDTAVDIVSSCTEKANHVLSKIQEKVQDKKCSPLGGILMMCIMKETFDQCPDGKWQNTNFCNKIKSGECFPKRGGGQ
uniref:Uncharacterized protein n=1 Tax=Anopheles dirus TaxID=7168 RepID=A0A182NMD9_9DIPT